MNDHPVHRDDITAMNKQGDLKSYMRSLIQPTKSTTPETRRRKPSWGAIPIPPDHKPGQWPPGTSPPGPAPERSFPAETWDRAVHDYRTTSVAHEEETQ
ncbi:hypothetical protein [Streptomyces spinosisporus]|uniref:Uncharacterized protein n=1 Tax=Streptomyces spinosisporus TaxID=2927582 RepID=A0ABS9XYR9_9ACTN|nr:hypothetical protein [Streptomyces spinosisporus]MCI3246486.1 hypothetical protein [Streptomyces spinosisporus]